MAEYKTECANSLFEQPWWLDIVAPGAWEEAVCKDKNGDIQARIAYVHNTRRVYMPTLTQTMGIWMREDIKKDYAVQKEIIYRLFEEINRHKKIKIRLAPENEYILPFRWMGYSMEPCFTYRISNLGNYNKLYESFNKNVKRNIKSSRNEVDIHYKTDVDVLLALLDKTFEAQNRKNPTSKNMIRSIMEVCEKNGHGQYIDARDEEGNIRSCGYFVYDEKVWYYLFGASDPRFKSSAQSLVMWEAIQMAAEKSKVFDFEGSMVEGIENFFRQFGGRCIPYYEVRKNSLLEDVMSAAKPRLKRMLGYKI